MSRKIVLKVLNPAGDAKVAKRTSAPRVGSLEGKRIGLIYNEKPQGDILLQRTAELLKERFKNIEITWYSRQCCEPPPEGYIEAAVKGSDVGIGAAGD
jgi:hypothetical protein